MLGGTSGTRQGRNGGTPFLCDKVVFGRCPPPPFMRTAVASLFRYLVPKTSHGLPQAAVGSKGSASCVKPQAFWCVLGFRKACVS